MRFSLQRFQALSENRMILSNHPSSHAIPTSDQRMLFRATYSVPWLQRLNPFTKPFLFAKALNLARRKWTLLRFGPCGFPFPASKLTSQLSSSYAVSDAPFAGTTPLLESVDLPETFAQWFVTSTPLDLFNLVITLSTKPVWASLSYCFVSRSEGALPRLWFSTRLRHSQIPLTRLRA
jgi:hypothetical protein